MRWAVALAAVVVMPMFVALPEAKAQTFPTDFWSPAVEPRDLGAVAGRPWLHWTAGEAEPVLPPLRRPTPERAPGDAGESWVPRGDEPPAWTPEGIGPEKPGFFQLPEERFRGPGEPLLRESWSYRPFHIGVFTGLIAGSTLIEDWVGQSTGIFLGFRLGWDFDPYFGVESRVAIASLDIFDGQVLPQNRLELTGRNNDALFWDVDLLYYPWGDSRWRPYASLGFGAASVEFQDQLGKHWENTNFAMPIGMGIKYRQGDFLTFRFDMNYILVLGSGQTIETTHHFAMMLGGELHFGGQRRVYWPWNPGRHYW
jgi:hypothetical protein